MPTPPPRTPWPKGYVASAELGPGSWRARKGTQDVVLRVLAEDDRLQAAAELDVLSRLEGLGQREEKGLGQLIDHGQLPDGSLFVARAWIEGRPLGPWTTSLTHKAVGLLLARLAEALERLHRAGFVHGDVKPENVVVDSEGRPHLVDFGLTRSSAPDPEADRSVSGSLIYLSPERLAGEPPDVASDLFAFGVLALRALGLKGRSPQQFYGAFPREPFLEAFGLRPEDLPGWSRDLLSGLLDRRAPRRPASALDVSRWLRRLHGLPRPDLPPVVLRPPLDLGRREGLEKFLEHWIEPDERCALLSVEDAREVSPIARLLSVEATLRGLACRSLDLVAASEAWTQTRDLDEFAREALGGPSNQLLLVHVTGDTPLNARALGHLARTRRQIAPDLRLGVVVAGPPPEPRANWLAESLAPVSPEVLNTFLAELVEEPESQRLERLSKQLVKSTRGSVVGLWDQLSLALSAGLLLEAEDRLRIRRGPLVLPAPSVACAEEPAASLAGLVEPAIHRARELREASEAELALACLDELQNRFARASSALPQEVHLERALAWVELGRTARARTELEQLAPETDGERASYQLVQARIARAEGDWNAVRAALAVAVELDPKWRTEAALVEVQVAFQSQRAAEAAELATAALSNRGAESSRAEERVVLDLLRTRALAQLQLGHVEAARTDLYEALSIAESTRHKGFEPMLRMNLGTLERRTGSLESAAREFRGAMESFRELGRLAAEATARAQLGGTLRELGHMGSADQQLTVALAQRERLGDERGAATVQALLALLAAECGALIGAREGLERAIEALGDADRRKSAPLLEAHWEVVEVRLGGEPVSHRHGSPEASSSDSGVVDPRVWLERGRARLLARQPSEAEPWLRRAEDLAKRLDQRGVALEAGFLAWLAGRDSSVPLHREELSPWRASDSISPSLAQDIALFAALLTPGQDGETELEALYEALNAAGRLDRAARAALALARRSTERAQRDPWSKSAEELLDRCARGAEEAEREHLRRTLLGFPDPAPDDLQIRHEAHEEDATEMEILKLLEINHRLAVQEDLNSLLPVLVASACSVTGAERGFLVLEENGELRVDVALDTAHGEVAPEEVELSTSAVRAALNSMELINTSNAVEDPLLESSPSVISLELRSILCAPFHCSDKLRGVIVVDDRLRTGAFGPRAERLLRLLADQAVLAIGQVLRTEHIRNLANQLSNRVAAQERDLDQARRALRTHGIATGGTGLVGSSGALSKVREALDRVAPTDLAVLLRGPSGSGKELAARAVHDLSPRADGAFVGENVAALPGSLIESELFGYRRGAFTGADSDRAGLVERAQGGTLFLDEIGEMPQELQAKLLRVLETHRVRRLGDEQEIEVDFRLVTATHRDLAGEVREGRFREDLFYRLAGVEVRLPGLDERRQDISELVAHFLALEADTTGALRKIAPEVLRRLESRPWPGNVRELRNEVRRLLALSDGDVTDPDLVSAPAMRKSLLPVGTDELPTLAELERQAIQRAIEITGGDKTEAARRLGISRAKIYQRVKEWNL